MPDSDVFLSHNSQDNAVVKEIGKRLESRGISVWLDEWELRPGLPWQEGLEVGIRGSRAVAVLVGAEGLSAWQTSEMRAFLARSGATVPVIPVLLPGCPDSPQLTLFLEARTWVDLRTGITDEGLERLVWGINGTRPERAPEPVDIAGPVVLDASRQFSSERSGTRGGRGSPRGCTLTLSLLSLAVVVAGLPVRRWLESDVEPTPTPVASAPTAASTAAPTAAPTPGPPPSFPGFSAPYAVRVHVLDPRGQPTSVVHLFASAGKAPQKLPDGSWEIEIPAAKVPVDGIVSIWAESAAWGTSRIDVRLDRDRNPTVEIRLKAPESLLRGRVVTGVGQAIAGAQVSTLDGTPGAALTGEDGRFELKLSVPGETRVRLRADRAGKVGEAFCFAGRDSCTIEMEQQ